MMYTEKTNNRKEMLKAKREENIEKLIQRREMHKHQLKYNREHRAKK